MTRPTDQHQREGLEAVTEDQAFDCWCVVELLGRRRLAGRVSEVQLAGHGFLRLDIPPADDDPGRTQYFAPASVYALHPVEEATARRAAAAWRPAPVQRWELPAAKDTDDQPYVWAGDRPPSQEDLIDDDEQDEEGDSQP